MSKVINKTTFIIIEFANTPDFMDGNWIINPSFIPQCPSKYWKVVGENLEEMTLVEKEEVDYITSSNIYLIVEKQLLTNKNGYDYELDTNAIINPIMPQCDVKYTKVINGIIVEMDEFEKNIMDHPAKPIEFIRQDLKNINNMDKLRSKLISTNNKINSNNFLTEDIIPAIKELVENQKEILNMISDL